MKKFYLIIWCSFFFLYESFGQTLIDPGQGGGFDLGNTFALNGWTVANSSANKWVIGPTTFNSPPYSAYISSDGNVSHYSYDNTTAHISHFYKQVTLPANAIDITLSIFLKGNVESDADLNVIDGLTVYTDEAMPVADALPGGPNTVVRFPQFNSQFEYTQNIISAPDLAGKTFYLIFTWVNNGNSIGDGPPASVDGISLTYCIKATDYNLTGGGAFCTGSSGVNVGLAGSTTGISYQLYNNGTPVGSLVAGTDSPIDFGLQNVAGNYTVVGTSACNYTYPMPGSVTVTKNPLPVATAGNNSPVCSGSALNLTSGGGATYSWTGPNSFTSSNQNPSISNVTTAASGTYTVSVTNGSGCAATATTDVTITSGGVADGTITSVAVCSGGNGSLTLSGNITNPIGWEYSTDSTSVSWTPISNVTVTQTFTNITVPTFYRAKFVSACGNSHSSIGTVSIRNYWTGKDITNPTDWNTAANWSDKQVPSLSCPNAYIPNTPNKPVLGAGIGTVGNLYIDAGAILTITNTGILQIAGAINNSGTLDATNGTLEFNGTATAQTISGSMFKNKTIKDLIISNSAGLSLSATPNDTLNITAGVNFGVSNATFTTHDNLTLKSTAAGTASVGVLSSNNDIAGKVTVERYINVGTSSGYHGKSWQFLATPTRGQSVWDSWMEGGTMASTGYGTQVIGPNAAVNNFDTYPTNLPSLKYYDYVSDSWKGIGNTKTTQVYDQRGYMLFVRGDRSKKFPDVGNTTLRTKGTLFTAKAGNKPPVTTVKAGKFESVGNPYASAIDMRKFGLAGGAAPVFIVWDPALGGAYGLGAFVTLQQTGGGSDNNFYATPISGSYGAGPNNFIQSGQAFFVQATGSDGTITFNESAKAGAGSYKNVLRGGSANETTQSQLRTNLYGVNADASTFLTDGNLVQFNESYSNKIDRLDARKQVNSAENLGIKSDGKYLAIERRHGIVESDTIFYNLTGVRVQNYQLEFIANDLSAYGLQGYVEDTYLSTQTPLNMDGVTKINFAVTNAAGSKAANRFRIVFRQAPLLALPVTFVSVKAYQKEADVAVEWKVENEKDMQQYEVEKSTDGVRFSKSATVNAVNNGTQSYQWIDQHATPGNNYYRIRSVEVDGKVNYSTVVKVAIVFAKPSIGIYPNPITDGIIHLQLINQPEGMYGMKLINSLGQVIVSKQVGHAGGNATENIKWDYNLSHGVYHLEVTKPGGEVVVIKVMY